MDGRGILKSVGVGLGCAYLLWYIYAVCAGWRVVTGH